MDKNIIIAKRILELAKSITAKDEDFAPEGGVEVAQSDFQKWAEAIVTGYQNSQNLVTHGAKSNLTDWELSVHKALENIDGDENHVSAFVGVSDNSENGKMAFEFFVYWWDQTNASNIVFSDELTLNWPENSGLEYNGDNGIFFIPNKYSVEKNSKKIQDRIITWISQEIGAEKIKDAFATLFTSGKLEGIEITE